MVTSMSFYLENKRCPYTLGTRSPSLDLKPYNFCPFQNNAVLKKYWIVLMTLRTIIPIIEYSIIL